MISCIPIIKQVLTSKNAAINIAIILFGMGLLLRISAIPMYTSSDVTGDARWGKNMYTEGLAKSFKGVYFPIQYYIFSGAYAVSQHAPIDTESVLKIFNIIFEIGILGLIYFLTRKYIVAWKLMVIYWLNPFNLIMSEQGYIDPQTTFFIVLSLFLLINQISRYPYVLAGVPIGIAFMMKPQATPIFIGIILLVIIFVVRKEFDKIKLLGIFVFPAILFIIFSLYFGFNLEMKGHKTLPVVSTFLQEKVGMSRSLSDFAVKSTWLGIEYAYVPNNMPAINAYMPNAWFFVAESMRPDNVNIYRVKDTDRFIGISYRNWGLLMLLTVLVLLIIKIIHSNQELRMKMVWVILSVPVLVPFLATSAHENHFFYGFTSLILMGILMSDRLIIYSGYCLGVLSGVNILYIAILPHYLGIGLNVLYPTIARVPIMTASSLIFFFVLHHLLFRAKYLLKDEQVNIGNEKPEIA